jgi:methylenetetrahydrofolate reductase (NADPH)
VIARLESASDPKAEGIRIAVESVEALRKVEGVHGVHLMAVGWEDAIPSVVKGAGLLPRPSA